jgi:hypothetical protein
VRSVWKRSKIDACALIARHDPDRAKRRVAARQRDTAGDGAESDAISAIIFFTMARPNDWKFSATITNAPGPPITLSR